MQNGTERDVSETQVARVTSRVWMWRWVSFTYSLASTDGAVVIVVGSEAEI